MKYNGFKQCAELEPLPPEERPTFSDLESYVPTEVGRFRGAIRRYLTPRNPGRSIRFYTVLGVPLIRNMIMRTMDRPGYRLDHDRTELEALTSFAYETSVFNEAAHTAGAFLGSVVAGAVIELGMNDHHVAEGGVIYAAANVALVALQRYNRARLIQRIDKQLQQGGHYPADYTNPFGIDERAINNYRASLGGGEGDLPGTQAPAPVSFAELPVNEQEG